MMDFYKVFIEYIDYIHSIRKLESFLSFDMKFPTKWGLPKSYLEEGKLVPFETGDENFKGFSFVCQITEKDISDVLLKIGKAIKLNKDREIKDKLFKETIEKLKQTFEKTELDKLKTLYFDFEIHVTELNQQEDGQESEIIGLAE
jgi:hypothetical protein